MPHGVRFARERGERGCFLCGDRHGLLLFAPKGAKFHADLLIKLADGVGLFELRDGLLCTRARKNLVVLACERAHGLGAGGSALGRRDGLAVELKDSHEIPAHPQLAFKLAELGDGFGCGGHRQLQST